MAPPRAMSCTCLFFKALFNSGVLLFFICRKLATATPARVAQLHKTRYAAGFPLAFAARFCTHATTGCQNHHHCQRHDRWPPQKHKASPLKQALSGIAGATSWLFYFLALKTGQVSQVAPIDKLSVVFSVLLAIALFGEHVSAIHALAIALIAAGGLMLAIF